MEIKFMRIFCNVLYYLGHWLSFLVYSRINDYIPIDTYKIYNWLMCKSCEISDKYNLDIWKEEENVSSSR